MSLPSFKTAHAWSLPTDTLAAFAPPADKSTASTAPPRTRPRRRGENCAHLDRANVKIPPVPADHPSPGMSREPASRVSDDIAEYEETW
jgi:hypothetical protein